MVNIMWKLQVPNSYGLGKFKKWHVTCDTWQVVSKSIIYSPGKHKTIWIVSMFFFCIVIIYKSTLFVLRLDLHCYLPNFRNVSNTNGTPSKTSDPIITFREFICPSAIPWMLCFSDKFFPKRAILPMRPRVRNIWDQHMMKTCQFVEERQE